MSMKDNSFLIRYFLGVNAAKIYLFRIKSVLLEDGGHLLLEVAGTVGSDVGKVLGGVGVDDGAAAVDDEAAVVVPAVPADFLETASLCANAGDEQEMVGCQAAYVGEGSALSGADDVHEQAFAPLPLEGVSGKGLRGCFFAGEIALDPFLRTKNDPLKQP